MIQSLENVVRVINQNNTFELIDNERELDECHKINDIDSNDTTADYLIFLKKSTKIEFRRFSTIFSDFLIFFFISSLIVVE